MKKSIRIVMKISVIIVLTLLFIRLIKADEMNFKKKQPEGAYITAEEVRILVEELLMTGDVDMDEEAWKHLLETDLKEPSDLLSYAVYEQVIACMLEKVEPTRQESIKSKLTYSNKYQKGFWVLKEDWYKSYEQLLSFWGLEGEIRRESVEILCSNEELTGDGQIEANCLLGQSGLVYEVVSDAIKEQRFRKISVYKHDNRLLTLLQELPQQMELENVYLLHAKEQELCFFYEGYEILCPVDLAGEVELNETLQEQIGTIAFEEGKLTEVHIKSEKISGKLVMLKEDSLEIEGKGIYEIEADCTGYQIYEQLRKVSRQELLIGCDYTDFILENGKVCAFLITREENMDNIRVAVKNNEFRGLYHEKIILKSNANLKISYGVYGQRQQVEIKAGEEIVITSGCKYLSGNRMEVSPVVNTGKIQVTSLQRSQGTPAFRGSLEIVETEKGMVLINEVLLEEYLYSVVPSEMPASYPKEALKAQAVCARTYAYHYLKKPGYSDIGAHVDDSVGYQVYNNIEENSNTTKAVRETTGELLLFHQEPANMYYYSTSCGYGTDAGIWNEEQQKQMPFEALHIADEDAEEVDAAAMIQEDAFRNYICNIEESAFEKEEPWYRWEYRVEQLNTDVLYERLRERYEANPEKILTYTGEENPEEDLDSYEARKPSKMKYVKDIRCLKRREGGVMDELLLITDTGTYKIISEYNIRCVLNQGGQVIRKDGSAVPNGVLLPSAYFVIDIVSSEKNVIRYKLTGGGYGHGVGMSQNGAKVMGAQGKDCSEILSFFFKSCEIEKIY